jgi:hypothetical protein
MNSDRFRLGDAKAVCDRCGFDKYQSQLRKEWTGAMTCAECWDSRHPQDFVKARPERNHVKNARPSAEPRFVGPNEITADDL